VKLGSSHALFDAVKSLLIFAKM